MTRFVISDHHFDHENIIDYTDREFHDATDMNGYMSDRWSQIVSEDDVVLYGGDLAMAPAGRVTQLLDVLPGSVLYVRGNHDGSVNPDRVPFPAVEHTTVQHEGYRFWYTHDPADVPEDWTEWVLHGHVHNDAPFIDYDANRVNVSVEAVQYTPVPLPQITKALNAMGNGEVAETIKDSPIQHHQWYQQHTPW